MPRFLAITFRRSSAYGTVRRPTIGTTSAHLRGSKSQTSALSSTATLGRRWLSGEAPPRAPVIEGGRSACATWPNLARRVQTPGNDVVATSPSTARKAIFARTTPRYGDGYLRARVGQLLTFRFGQLDRVFALASHRHLSVGVCQARANSRRGSRAASRTGPARPVISP